MIVIFTASSSFDSNTAIVCYVEYQGRKDSELDPMDPASYSDVQR